jgi:hypothetical protein
MGEAAFKKRRQAQIQAELDAHLATLSPEDRTRYETLRVASDKCRETAHWMLDEQLNGIMPELLTHIDAGGTFAVLVVDPQQMPVMPEESKLVKPNGTPIHG